MRQSGHFTGGRLQVLKMAHGGTNRHFGGAHNYSGNTPNLRMVLQTGKMDCIMATDMIGSLYRNAGRPGFFNVRICQGFWGHTIAAAEVADGGSAEGPSPNIRMVDGLQRSDGRELQWPSALDRSRSTYAAEIYVRGLDGYVWAEGYTVSGDKAGHLTRACIPYIAGWPEISRRKLFDGPYPARPR